MSRMSHAKRRELLDACLDRCLEGSLALCAGYGAKCISEIASAFNAVDETPKTGAAS